MLSAEFPLDGVVDEAPFHQSSLDKRRALLDAWSAFLAGDVAVIAEGGLSLRQTNHHA